MSTFSSPGQIARLLLFLDYSEDSTRRAILSEFPDADVDAAITSARRELRKVSDEHDALLEREAAAARAAELDLTKSMHDTEAE